LSTSARADLKTPASIVTRSVVAVVMSRFLSPERTTNQNPEGKRRRQDNFANRDKH
jgi:hypothetical protein